MTFGFEPSSNEHQARKRFGQNFLVDDNIIHNIVAAINPQSEQRLIEIGPGKGALTQPLLQHCPNLTVIELDRDLIDLLQAQQERHPQFTIVEGDALKTDFSRFFQGEKLRIVGNLPYNISTPLLFHLLSYRDIIADMHFMLQKEVVERLGAQPNTKNYGRLSVMVQYHARVDQLFTVSPHCFSPAPKVTSAIVRILPFKSLPFPAQNPALFSKIVAACFQTRRKTLRNNLRKLCSEDLLQNLDLDTGRRPETLSVEEFVSLSNQLQRAGCE